MNNYESKLTIGVDVGGTFTDFFFYDFATDHLSADKILTDAGAPEKTIVKGIRRGLARLSGSGEDIQSIIHGTTLVVNAVIERKGAKTGLLTTKGFRDILEARKEKRYDLYDLGMELPPPLVPRRFRLGVSERLDEEGQVNIALDEVDLIRAVESLQSSGVESLAICFLHSYRNPAHELRAGEIIGQRFSSLPVSLSSQVVPEIREYERFSTTVANAYILPLVSRYLKSLSTALFDLGYKSGVFVMLSHGGIAPQQVGTHFPIRMIESGPVGGVFGAIRLAREAGVEHILSFDMGGTTAKLCLVDRFAPSITSEYEVARVHRFKRGSGISLRLPAIDLLEIGAGGGSIAKINPLGLIEVGPESAGSFPGPAAYGFGGVEPTVTDADLILGFLRADYFLGGNQRLSLESARQVIEQRLAVPLGVAVAVASTAIYQTVNQNMANAARIYLAERGEDAGKYTLVAFGGAGPVHACALARALGIRNIIIPPLAGVASALGFLTSPRSFESVRTFICRLDDFEPQKLSGILAEMTQQGRETLQILDTLSDTLQFQFKADMRYIGQKHEVTVPLPAGHEASRIDKSILKEGFEKEYRRIFGRTYPEIAVEVLNWRVVVSAPTPPISLADLRKQATPTDDRPQHWREVVADTKGNLARWPVYRWQDLLPGRRFAGPALIEDPFTTVVVSEFFDFELGATMSIHLSSKGSGDDKNR